MYWIASTLVCKSRSPDFVQAFMAIVMADNVSIDFYFYYFMLDPHISMYSGDLKSGIVWISNGKKEVGLQKVHGIWNLEAQPLEIQTNGSHFVKTIWNPDKNVQILNGTVLKWLGAEL